MIKLFSVLFFVVLLQSSFASETVKGAKKDLEVFKQEMSAKLQVIENDLKVMSEKAEKKSDTLYNDAVKDLKVKRDKLRSDLNELQADTKGEWKEAKAKISSSLNSLNERVQKALKDD